MFTSTPNFLRFASASLVLVVALLNAAAPAAGQRRRGTSAARPRASQPVAPRVPQTAQSRPVVVAPVAAVSLPELVRLVKPSVVAIRVFDANGKAVRDGSAFFIAPGRVVTNYHVIEGGATGEIYTHEGFAYAVPRVLSTDAEADLAILEVELPSGVQIRTLPIARKSAEEGEEVVVIGSPMGLQGTVSQGIVSAVRQYRAGRPWLQTTAPISQGSSGSPLINLRGEVVGVATLQSVQGQNLNFAVPSSLLAALSERAERWSKAVRLYDDGVRLYRGGNYSRALEMFTQALKLSPGYAVAWMNAGYTRLALDDPAGALAAFTEATRIEPNNAAAFYGTGVACARLGHHADAIGHFRRVLLAHPNNVEVHVEVGNAYYALGDFRRAIDSYKEALRARPDYVPAHYNLGIAYLARDDCKAARKQVKKLEELSAHERASDLRQRIPR